MQRFLVAEFYAISKDYFPSFQVDIVAFKLENCRLGSHKIILSHFPSSESFMKFLHIIEVRFDAFDYLVIFMAFAGAEDDVARLGELDCF